jgi:hypothetical protein
MTLLYEKRKMCNWIVSSEGFSTGDDTLDKNRIMCIVEGKFSAFTKDYKILVSDDFFKSSTEPPMWNGRTMSGMINMAAVKGFIVAAAKATGSKELALFVTKDGMTWHRAEFSDHRIEEDSYTILESTKYSLQVEVTTETDGLMGVIFSSNSNGTYFTKLEEHVNRDRRGIMDFEKVSSIQGVFLVNTVKNWEDVQKNPGARKQLESHITFDDGRTFEDLKVGNDKLHVYSVTWLVNTGRVFSSPAPGILMANGKVGDHLEGDISQSELYVSDDAGKNWIKAGTQGPQFYEFGDQGSILLAINAGPTDDLSYSIDHGKTWQKAPLGLKDFQISELTTVPDSTSLKFLVTGISPSLGGNWYTLTIDFADLHERKCGSGDMETWYARKDESGKPMCLMGHTQHFQRRKADADCFVQNEFKEELPISETCECTDLDYECDWNFRRSPDRKECYPVARLLDPENQCASREGEFDASSGWRLIPGNDCKPKRGPKKDDTVKRPCSDAFDAPASGEISAAFKEFRGGHFVAMHYLERDPKATGTDETVLVLTNLYEAWKTHDHGKTWELVTDDAIHGIIPHRYANDRVYFITASNEVYYSVDRAKNINKFIAPDVPKFNGMPVLSFHQGNENWLIWTGNQNCDMDDPKYCKVSAHVSKHHGNRDSWDLLMDHVKRCSFMYQETRPQSENLIFCEHWKDENVQGALELISTETNFEKYEPAFKDVVAYATMAEFIIVAEKVDNHLRAHASIDGKVFAHAAFPPGYTVEHEQAYTVLDSATNSIFLHVTQNGRQGREYGDILKSNSNGTNYILSIENVNRNKAGYVDWEKMQGLEGVAMVNVLANVDAVNKGTADKSLKTMITHDDGATWLYLNCPDQDLDGQAYGCNKNNLEKKSLHLHGYTERRDPRETFSSPSAVGLMLGVGNVGETLGIYNEGDTFLTEDGGVTWRMVQKGAHMWEYGDQGSIIVLVRERNTPTDRVLYSLDEGRSWKSHVFDSDGTMIVELITTVPSDNSRNFMLWGRKDGKLTTVNLDFSGLSDVQCVLDKEKIADGEGDYNLWSPLHPGKTEQPDCLFGHKSRYYRKKPEVNCYNGPLIERLHDIERNCSCTRQDFEWYVSPTLAVTFTDLCSSDYNYHRMPDHTCHKYTNLPALPADAVCSADPGRAVFYDPTGYRKLAISTCSGGRELEYIGEAHDCPGHEGEADRRNGGRLGGAGLFFAVVIPIGFACAAGYYVWRNWDGKFGRIRLGGDGGPGFSALGDGRTRQSPWVEYPIAFISGLVAVAVATPLLLASLWRSAKSAMGMETRGRYGALNGGRTYTSRSSFARGRGEFGAEQVEDEGELLGDESDEEV